MQRVQLPTFDLQRMTGDAGERARLAREVREISSDCGAFQITGHGIDADRVLAQMRRFFALPQADKDAIAIRPGGFTRGYIGLGEESGSTALEVKEAFSYGYAWDPRQPPANALQGPNVWPAESVLPEFRGAMEQFFAAACRTARQLGRLYALALGLGEEHFDAYSQGGETISLMRLCHYLPYERAEARFPGRKDRIGSSAHTDWGFLTLVLQQPDVTGLQIRCRGAWQDVEPRAGAIVVHCGDYLSLISGGRFISPVHRVVSGQRDRLSAVFFGYPDFEARIPPLRGADYSLFADQQRGGAIDAQRLERLAFGEFLAEKWRQVQRAAT